MLLRKWMSVNLKICCESIFSIWFSKFMYEQTKVIKLFSLIFLLCFPYGWSSAEMQDDRQLRSWCSIPLRFNCLEHERHGVTVCYCCKYMKLHFNKCIRLWQHKCLVIGFIWNLFCLHFKNIYNTRNILKASICFCNCENVTTTAAAASTMSLTNKWKVAEHSHVFSCQKYSFQIIRAMQPVCLPACLPAYTKLCLIISSIIIIVIWNAVASRPYASVSARRPNDFMLQRSNYTTLSLRHVNLLQWLHL